MKNKYFILCAIILFTLFIVIDKLALRDEVPIQDKTIDEYILRNDSVIDLVDENIKYLDDFKRIQQISSADNDSLIREVFIKNNELEEQERKQIQYRDSIIDLKRQKNRVLRLPKTRSRIKKVNLSPAPELVEDHIIEIEVPPTEVLLLESDTILELEQDTLEQDTLKFKNKKAERLYNQYRKAQGW